MLKRMIPTVVNILSKVIKLLYMGFQDGERRALVNQLKFIKKFVSNNMFALDHELFNKICNNQTKFCSSVRLHTRKTDNKKYAFDSIDEKGM